MENATATELIEAMIVIQGGRKVIIQREIDNSASGKALRKYINAKKEDQANILDEISSTEKEIRNQEQHLDSLKQQLKDAKKRKRYPE